MARRKIIDDYPAYTVYEAKTFYTDGDVIAIARETSTHGKLYTMYTLGSAAGCAIKYGECPFEVVKREQERGHKLHWANQNSVSICNWEQPKEYYYEAKHGDVIRFHGKDFLIEKTWNQNINLKEVNAEEMA